MLTRLVKLFVYLAKEAVFMALVIMVDFEVSVVEAFMVIAIIVSFLKVVGVATNLYFTIIDVLIDVVLIDVVLIDA